MSSYVGRHAELYDIFYRDKPYEAEAAFVHSILQEYSEGDVSSLLELSCGTGTHAFALEKLGYQITATDYSESMISVAREKARLSGSQVSFLLQDMRTLKVDPKSFDAAICLFDSIGYVLTNEGICQTLRGVHHSLREKGIFLFEFWNAGALLRNYEPTRIRRFDLPSNRQIVRISETSLNYRQQSCTVMYTVYELQNNRVTNFFAEKHENRFFQIQEMALFLTFNGFIPLRWHAGYSSQAVDENTWHVVAVARKGDMPFVSCE